MLEGDVWIAAHYGEIVAVGHGFELRPRLELSDDAVIVDAQGMVAVPGLVDCHTHACFAGDRVDEFDRRARGATYEEIHAAGGGILSTVEATRAAGLDALTDQVARHMRWMLEHGTTSVEIKSGYGLDLESELDMLRAIRAADAVGSQRVISTVLAAHTVPPEAADADAYIQLCVDEILPEVDEWGLATHADVFCERGAFDVEQSRRYLQKARELGLELRLHGDQFSEIGAIPLAVELGRQVGRPPRGDRARGHRDARGVRRDRRDAAGRVPHARSADAAGARADRRGCRGRARERLQPGLELLRVAPARDGARVHAHAA